MKMSVKFIYIKFIMMLLLGSCMAHKAGVKNPVGVGEPVALSARVAKVMTDPIKKEISPKRILEIGAGEGSITEKIITKLNSKDHLDIVEIEQIFCDTLNKKFGHLPNVSIYCVDFTEFESKHSYDSIISTMPFNVFPPELLQLMLDKIVELAKDQATLAYVAYKWVRPFRRMGLASKEEKISYEKNLNIIDKFFVDHAGYATDVFINFPPIEIFHLKINKSLITK